MGGDESHGEKDDHKQANYFQDGRTPIYRGLLPSWFGRKKA